MIKRWERLLAKRCLKVIGLNSGTSCDGIDAAVVEIEGWGKSTRLRLLAYKNYNYTEETRRMIEELFNPQTSGVDKICVSNFYLGELFAQAALEIIKEAGMTPGEIDLIGSHGQTIYHRPGPVIAGGIPVRSTLQIGEATVIAERTGVLTIADFRPRDLAVGGEGAPLIPYVDDLLFGRDNKHRVIQNIGGIANLTLVGGAIRPEEIIAFDTGPGNMVIDGVVSNLTAGRLRYDRDGLIAAEGRVHTGLMTELLTHPFLAKKPPKSTGREEFGAEFIGSVLEKARKIGLTPQDLTATVTAFTVESIAQHYEEYIIPRYSLDEIIIGGGGAYNPTLMRMMEERMAPIPVKRHEDYGLSSDAKEAVAFAVLANETIHGLPANLPSVTGAVRPVVLGKIIP